MPFEGPLATVRVGRIHTDNGPQYIINPTVTQLDYSDLDLVLSGHKDGVNMIEVGAAEVDEAGVLGAIEFGQQTILQICGMIDELTAMAGKPKRMGELMLPAPEVTAKIATIEPKMVRRARSRASRPAARPSTSSARDARQALPRQDRRDLRRVCRERQGAFAG